MAIVTYPLDGPEYDATDAAGYFSTRCSGVYSAEDDFAVTAAGGTSVTVSAGVAWIHPDRWTGYSVLCREAQTLELPAADGIRTRIDRVVLRYDAAARQTRLQVLEGTPDSASPTAPDITRTALVYDLCLAEITRPAGSTAITAANLTDTRADEDVCGVMRDGVTGIPTAELLKQAQARIAELEETASDSAAAADKSAKAAAASQTAAAGSASTASTKASAAAGSASTAQSAASTATTQATTATRQAAAAAGSASTAKASEGNAKTSETEAAAHLQATKEYFEQVRTITIGAQGWYATPEALMAAVPIGENGWWAVVGTTDTIWTWDSDTGAWVNTQAKVDLSDFYTQAQVDALLKAQKLADHPVGSAFFTISDDDPAQLFGGTWMKIAEDRAIMGASTTHAAGSTAEAGLPNIVFNLTDNYFGESPTGTGGVSVSVLGSTHLRSGGNMPATYGNVSFKSSGSSAVYGRSDTVQPAAYYMNVWIRLS